jgi:hypothetical protein
MLLTVLARDLIPSLREAGSAPDRVALLLLSSRECRVNNTRSHRTGSPFTAGRRCILPKSVASF